MEIVKDKLKRINQEIFYMSVEYIIDIWIIITSIVNLLNLVGVVGIHSGFMKPTLFGGSLLILLLLQYGLIWVNKGNGILNKIRPYVMGIAAADIVSACNLPLCLMLLLLIGYFLVSGIMRKCSPGEAALILLIACVGIEIYSVVCLMHGEEANSGGAGKFLISLWPDVLFIGAALLYHFATRSKNEEDEENTAFITSVENEESMASVTYVEDAGNMISDMNEDDEKKLVFIMGEGCEENVDSIMSEEGEGECKNEKEKRWQQKEIWGILQRLLSWCRTDFMRLTRWIGSALCIISLGMFLYFIVSVGIGTQKISWNAEEVYLLRHCEDTSLVLTLEQEKETGEYVFSFQKYAGTNNQKVHLRDVGNGMHQLIFLSPECAVGVDNQMMPYADSEGYSSSQYWVKEVYDGENSLYRFISGFGAALCYSSLSKNDSYLSIGNYGGDCEVFVLERTTGDEFITDMAVKHRDEFMPTILMETCSTLLGRWTSVIYILVAAAFFGIIYLRRILGDKLAVLYALFFVYLLAYGAISAIALLFLAMGLQCGCIYYRKSLKKQKEQSKV